MGNIRKQFYFFHTYLHYNALNNTTANRTGRITEIGYQKNLEKIP